MDKQTQMYVGLGVAAVAGYLIYNNWKKNQPVAPVPPVPPAKAFSGNVTTDVVGPRKVGMVGLDATQRQNAVIKDSPFAWGNFAGGNGVVADGKWASANGCPDPNIPCFGRTFFDTQDSRNSYRNR
jgi:hypothetical protein